MLTIQTILVYSLLASGMFLFSKRKKTSLVSIHQLVPILLFIFIFGLRYNVGIDWENYQQIYEDELAGMTFQEMLLSTRYEIGFLFIVFLCHSFNLSIYVFFSLLAAIQIIFIYYAFRDEKNNVISYIYITLILTGIATQGFCNVIRQNIAFCFFLYAIKFIANKKFVPYFLFCLLACCFHKISVILFPIYLLHRCKQSAFHNTLIQYALLILCLILSLSNTLPINFTKFNNIYAILGFDHYSEFELKTYKYGITTIVYFITNLTVILYSNKLKEFYNSTKFNIIYDLYFIGICCSLLFVGNMVLQRTALFFTNMLFIMYGYVLSFCVLNKKSYFKLYAAIIFALVTSFTSMIYHCQETTDAYVFSFQEELHQLKDMQREAHLFNRPN